MQATGPARRPRPALLRATSPGRRVGCGRRWRERLSRRMDRGRRCGRRLALAMQGRRCDGGLVRRAGRSIQPRLWRATGLARRPRRPALLLSTGRSLARRDKRGWRCCGRLARAGASAAAGAVAGDCPGASAAAADVAGDWPCASATLGRGGRLARLVGCGRHCGG